MCLLAACGGEGIDARSSTTVVDQTGGLPTGPAIPGAPEQVANRSPLPYCGAVDTGYTEGNPYDFIDIVPDADECYRSRAAAGLPAELISVGVTIEGDPYMFIQRLMPDGREIRFWDATQDKFGPMAWVMYECETYSEAGPSDEQCTEIEIAGPLP